jgi:predicted DNA-binding transcriptional regulator AlpA
VPDGELIHIVRVVPSPAIKRYDDMTQDSRPFGELPATGYVRQSQLIPAPVPFSSATLWRRVKAGTFPKPVKLSERVTAWRVEDVRQWLDAQAAQ